MTLAAQVGPYKIVDRLGAGGMGEVFLAQDLRLGRKVALKALTAAAGQTAEARQRLMREARAAAQLNHPNIAAVYDVIDVDDVAYIVMEYVEGETLAERVARGPLPLTAVLEIGMQIADALAEAHKVGIVHRDLKPANVALTPAGKVKILDFGLAHGERLDLSGATGPVVVRPSPPPEPGKVVGTPYYMPPEHLLGEAVDERGDIYSLGVTLFEMITGQRPFVGGDVATIAHAIVEGPLPHVDRRRPDLPARLDAAIARAMARRPEDRFQSARELQDELGRVTEAISDAPTLSTVIPLPKTEPVRAHARRVRRIAVTGVAVALAVAGAWWTAQRVRGPRPSAFDPRAPRVVAVLPPTAGAAGDLERLSLGAGFADVLAASLSKLPGVSVLPRASVIAEREKNQSMGAAELARRLGASLVVDGSLQRAGDRLRMTVQVVNVDSGAVAWSEVYDATVATVFDLQPRVAADVAQALRPGLTEAERRRLQRPATASSAAFGDYAQAWSYLEQVDVPGNLDRAIRLLESAVKRDPRFARAHAALAHASWSKFRITADHTWSARARDSATEALRLDPEDPTVHYALGLLYGDTGRPAEAMEEARTALRLQPDFELAHALLGDVLTEAGQYAEAEKEYRLAIALRPGYWRHHQGLGVLYYRAGRFDDAITAFRRVTELRPDGAWGYLMLGTCFHAQGRLKEAIPLYVESIRVAPDARAFSNLGTAHYELGQLPEAEAAYRKAIELDPNDPVKRRNLGDLHARRGERARAAEQYRAALGLAEARLAVNSRDGRTLALMAVLEAKLGRFEPALQHAREAREMSPASNDVIYKSAVVHALAGRREDALRGLEEAVAGGFPRGQAAADDDLKGLRADPRFVSLTAGKGA